MKRTILFVCVCLCVIGMATGCRLGDSWKLVWVEEFDGEDGLDTAVWSKIPRGGADWNNYMSDYDSLYAVRDGNLILRGIVNDVQPDDTASFLTGGVYTKGKKAFDGGRIEICAKFQGAKGEWPAFWMLPEEDSKWPEGGEIDIMERLNYDDYAYQTVHSHYTHDLGFENEPPHSGINSINPEDYNVYSVDIHRDSLVFAINHKHTLTYPRISTDKEGQFPFCRPFYLLIDMQLGGSWVGEIDPATLPVEMYIDWVKYYRKERCYE